MNKINIVLEHLFSLQQGKMNHSLDRIELLVKKLDAPHKKYPVIHIAGTNGKGSVCSLIASILQENGLKVGLYTSPHIIDFNERIRVNGTKITDEEIIKCYEFIENYATEIDASFFEITTAIAFEHFKNSNVDIAVIETGLGGRFDSTNVVEPILSVITSIDKDHCQILGNSIEEIAREKAGIIKRNSQVLIQDTNAKLMDIWMQTANEKSSMLFSLFGFPPIKLQRYSEDFQMILDLELPSEAEHFILPENLIPSQIKTNLIGSHQTLNIKTAIFSVLLISKTFTVARQAILAGIENVTKNTGFRYRIECVHKNPFVIIDVAHNPQSICRLVDTLKEVSSTVENEYTKSLKKWNFIFGAMGDKDIAKMLEFIKPICRKLIITAPQIERAASMDLIKEIAVSLDFTDIVCEESVSDAVHKIQEHTVICGSFYVIEEAVRAMDTAQ
jgi:dihydrofolate synthase/folylpolyglutamate synthase